MRQLALTDAMFALMEQPARNTQHIGIALVFDPSTAAQPVTFDRVVELYRRRAPLARAFREKLVRVPLDLDYPYWVDDGAFDVEFHVRHAAVPRPGTREQFLELFGPIASQPLDMSRPLWEAWFIEGLDAVDDVPPGSFVLLTKIHHAAVDGVAGMEVISALLEDEATAAQRTPVAWEPEETPDQRTLLMRALGAGISGPRKLGEALFRALPALQEQRKRIKSGEIVKPPKVKAPKTRFNAPVTGHRVHEGRSWPFAEVRRLKEAVPGTTINDLVLTVAGGALARYLAAKGELPEQSLVASVPISVRPEGEAGAGGNQVSMAFAELHTDIADPLDRLRAVAATMRTIKDYNRAVDAQSLAQTTAAMPGALLGLALRAISRIPPNDMMRVSNVVVTNVPGPQTPLTLLGARYVAGFSSGPSQDGIGLYNIITSFSGVLSIGLSACREMVPDPDFYGQCIADAFEELRAAIDRQSGAGAARPAKSAAAAKPKSAKPRPARPAASPVAKQTNAPSAKPSASAAAKKTKAPAKLAASAAAKTPKPPAAKPARAVAAKPAKAQPAKARSPGKGSTRRTSR